MSSPSMITQFSTNMKPLLYFSLREDNATSLSITIAQEHNLKSSQLWRNLEELGIYNPSAYVPKPTYDDEEEHASDLP